MAELADAADSKSFFRVRTRSHTDARLRKAQCSCGLAATQSSTIPHPVAWKSETNSPQNSHQEGHGRATSSPTTRRRRPASFAVAWPCLQVSPSTAQCAVRIFPQSQPTLRPLWLSPAKRRSSRSGFLASPRAEVSRSTSMMAANRVRIRYVASPSVFR